MSDSLQTRVLGAIHWSFQTWHFTGYKDPEDVSILPIAGNLYHVTFAVTTHVRILLHALYLDHLDGGFNSLFLDADTLAWLTEPRIAALGGNYDD